MAGSPGFKRWIGVLLLLAAGVFGLYLGLRPRAVEPPLVPTAGLEPAVMRSIDEARTAVRQTPKSAAAWGRLGLVLLAAQFPDAAETCFQHAGQLDPTEPRWPFFDALVLSLQDAQAAIPPLQRAVELCGDRPDTPRLKLAEVLVEQDRAEDAKAQYEQLLRSRPDHPLAHLGLARLAYARADYLACSRHLQRCLRSPFTRKATHTLLATLAAQRHDVTTAQREQVIVARLPEDQAWPNPYDQEIARCRVDRRSRLAAIGDQVAQNRLAEAAVGLEKLVRDEPDFDVAWQQLGYVRMQEKDFAGAETALTRALQCNPQCAATHYYLGCVQFSEGERTKAAEHFRRAAAIKPDYAVALLSLGQCLQALGDRAGAIQALQQAIASRPYSAQAHRELAELLLADNKPAEARQHLQEAVKLEPKDPKAARLLRTLSSKK